MSRFHLLPPLPVGERAGVKGLLFAAAAFPLTRRCAATSPRRGEVDTARGSAT
ncbi:hypothetical protein J2S76_002973 [Ancylobacter vacuolatus]|uniref:Uncharacterized protein n=1 Tax=Ancylobacter vacuolatus TaxID=223389 RepID=A0ABU0DJE3_9HYPH|nr:hypothetical protein [Ancylobacter vacuolatus]